MKVSIIDSVKDYVELLRILFDFPLIMSFLTSKPPFCVLFDSLNGVTGSYALAILLNKFSLPETSVRNAVHFRILVVPILSLIYTKSPPPCRHAGAFSLRTSRCISRNQNCRGLIGINANQVPRYINGFSDNTIV
jgi:hypothetical protein